LLLAAFEPGQRIEVVGKIYDVEYNFVVDKESLVNADNLPLDFGNILKNVGTIKSPNA